MALSRFSWDSDQDFLENMLQRSFAPLIAGLSDRGNSTKDGVSKFYPKFDVIQKDVSHPPVGGLDADSS